MEGRGGGDFCFDGMYGLWWHLHEIRSQALEQN